MPEKKARKAHLDNGEVSNSQTSPSLVDSPILPWREQMNSIVRGRSAITVAEAARVLGIGRNTAWRASWSKSLPTFRAQKTPSSPDSSCDDEGVLTLLFGERAGAKWRALYDGQWSAFYPSQSEADAALARKLRFYTSGSKEQTRRLLLASGLRREKWDEGRGSSTFFEASVIDAAFRQGGKVYVPREPHAEPNGGRFALIPDWVADRISASDLRVYRALGSFANRERTCFPSVATLATIARISERRVQIALRRLETAQCIATQRRWNASSLYMLPLRPPEQRGDGIDTPSGNDEEQRGDVFSVSLDEQRGDENVAPFVDENSKGVTFSHQRGDVFVHPKQYQEEVLAHEVGEASALSAHMGARAMQTREVPEVEAEPSTIPQLPLDSTGKLTL